jgi:hypothetical protein
MKFFARADDRFIERGADDSQRQLAILQLSKKRTGAFWLAAFLGVCTFVMAFAPGDRLGAGVGIGLAAAIQWMLVIKYESDLRLLMMVGKLKSLS